MRGVPPELAGCWIDSGGGGGGGDGNVGGAMPSMVPPKARGGGWLEVAGGGWLAPAGVAAGGGVEPVGDALACGANVGGAIPIIVPRRLAGLAACAGGVCAGGTCAGGTCAAAVGCGSGGDMTIVPPRPVGGASGRAKPHPVHTVCWSRFCVPHRPHCFIAPRTIAFSGSCRGYRGGSEASRVAGGKSRGFVRTRRFGLWG